MAADPKVGAAGLLVDAPAVDLSSPSKTGIDLLAHMVKEFSGKFPLRQKCKRCMRCRRGSDAWLTACVHVCQSTSSWS